MGEALQLYNHYRTYLKNHGPMEFPLEPNFGLENFKTLNLKSEGVSGDQLGQGTINKNGYTFNVVVKMFASPCLYNRIVHNEKVIRRPKKIIGKGYGSIFEIGNTMWLTKHILLNDRPITPHITFCLGYGISPFAYPGNESQCTGKLIPDTECHIIPHNYEREDIVDRYPQCNFWAGYKNHERDDIVRFMVVERAGGDLEQVIKFNLEKINLGEVLLEQFDYFLGAILVMISYTLYVLSKEISFFHGDLGPRNILFTQTKPTDKIWHYQIKTQDKIDNYYISAMMGIQPKLWDFSTSYLDAVPLTDEVFNYVPPQYNNRDDKPFKEDLSILLTKIKDHLQGTQSQLLAVIDDILSYSQKYDNDIMAKLFLDHPWVVACFTTYTNKEIEYTFSFPPNP